VNIALITGSGGLVGSEAGLFLHDKNFKIIGIDNDSRQYFFGKAASTKKRTSFLKKNLKNFLHKNIDIRNFKNLEKIFKKNTNKIKLIIHAAAQPSHDWAIKEPFTDFGINALGTLNLLELTRMYSPNAVFIYVSTNKVYGDTPNRLPLNKKSKRYEIKKNHKFFNGINESMSIDSSTHSLFGVSKASADLLVQEYGRNLGLKTGIFRLGCITGPAHAGAELHGFLSYLVKANLNKIKYTIFGYNGRQVRDNIHSFDLVNCFWSFFKKPKKGEIYNIGGGRANSCSILEAIAIIEKITKIKMKYKISANNRIGDHIWYITSNSKFKTDYPNWKIKHNLISIIKQIIKSN